MKPGGAAQLSAWLFFLIKVSRSEQRGDEWWGGVPVASSQMLITLEAPLNELMAVRGNAHPPSGAHLSIKLPRTAVTRNPVKPRRGGAGMCCPPSWVGEAGMCWCLLRNGHSQHLGEIQEVLEVCEVTNRPPLTLRTSLLTPPCRPGGSSRDAAPGSSLIGQQLGVLEHQS